MSNLNVLPKNSNKWEVVHNQSTQEFGNYLKSKSNGSNDWTWKPLNDCNLFFSPNGKLIAIVHYSGAKKTNTKTFLLKEN